jgi:hypothetical protein
MGAHLLFRRASPRSEQAEPEVGQWRDHKQPETSVRQGILTDRQMPNTAGIYHVNFFLYQSFHIK